MTTTGDNHSISTASPHASIPRRELLRGAGVLFGTAALGGSAALAHAAHAASAARPAFPQPARPRNLRIVHMTDLHIHPGRRAPEGVVACLRHIMALKDRPDLIVTGGDLINDGFAQNEAATRTQFELLTKVFRDECGLPVLHTLGNHDIWGWHKSKSNTTGNEPLWGKRWAQDALALAAPYAATLHNGWRIIRLDSTHPDSTDPNGYIARLDPLQADWFKAELAAPTPARHTLVVSHIPILSATAMIGKPDHGGTGEDQREDWLVRGGIMHTDSPALREWMEATRSGEAPGAWRGGVRACLSGHMHRIDDVLFRGVRYLCDGAVSGSWWKGPNEEATEGYAVLDLFDDGTVERSYETYGWQAEPA